MLMIVGGGTMAAYALAAMVTTYPAPLIVPVSFFLLLFLPGLGVAFHAMKSYVITSPEGVEYHSLFYVVRTGWDNIDRIGLRRRRQVVLYLKKSGYEGPKWLGLVLRGSGRDRRIPIGLYIADSGAGEFHRNLRRYAPHLLKKDASFSDLDQDSYL